jgi:hypothetical protein
MHDRGHLTYCRLWIYDVFFMMYLWYGTLYQAYFIASGVYAGTGTGTVACIQLLLVRDTVLFSMTGFQDLNCRASDRDSELKGLLGHCNRHSPGRQSSLYY